MNPPASSGQERSIPPWSMPGRRLTILPGVVAAALASVYMGMHGADARRVEDANRLGAAGSFEEAAAEARQVARRPAETRALQVEAIALTALGRHEEATAAWQRVAAREPNSWIVHLGLARTLLFAGDAQGARAALLRAKGLNPQLSVPDELRPVAAPG